PGAHFRTASTRCCSRIASRNRRSCVMADMHVPAARLPPLPPFRPEYLRETIAGGDIGVVQKALTPRQRLANQAWLRKAFILVAIAAVWEAYARHLNNPLLVPSFSATLEAFQA